MRPILCTLILGNRFFWGAVFFSIPSMNTHAEIALHKVEANGMTFDVYMAGPDNARPVMLLHGFSQNGQLWSVVSQELVRSGYRTIAPSLRGSSPGARPTGPEAYTRTLLISDVKAIADALNLEVMDLSGFALGGNLAWVFAASYPKRVKSLTIFSYPHPAAYAKAIEKDPVQREMYNEMRKTLNMDSPASAEQKAAEYLANDAALWRKKMLGAGLPEEHLALYLKMLTQPGALPAAIHWHNMVASMEESSTVPKVRVPTMLVWSEGSPITGGTASTSADYVKGQYIQRSVEDVGLFMIEKEPLKIAELLLEHLNLNR